MPTPTGTYEQLNGQPVIRFERTFPHSLEAVWAAVTEPAQLEKWFPTTVEFDDLRAGEAIDFHFAGDRYPPMTGEIREVSPPRRFVFTWADDVLAFELSAAGGGAGCRLAFSVALDTADKAARDGAGWDQCLDSLALVAGGAEPQHPSPRDAWQSYYDQYRERGFPATAEIPE